MCMYQWIMCILSPRDIMVVPKVFITYFFLKKIFTQSGFSGRVKFSSGVFSMTPLALSSGDKSVICRALPVELKVK